MSIRGISARHAVVVVAFLAACSVPSQTYTPLDDAGTDAPTDATEVVELSVSTMAVTVVEASTNTFTVQLTAQPASDILVSVDSADDNRLGVAPTSIQFTPQNWNQPRTVTVSGREDADTEDEAVNVMLTSSVGDKTVAVTVDDNDSLAIVTTPATTLQVDEGQTAQLAVHLSAQPSGSVNVTVMSSNTNAATVSPTTLTFGTGTWDVDQNVVVSGVVDADTANGSADVMLMATGVTGAVVPIQVIDSDVLGILPSPPSLGTLTEGGTTTFTVRLTQQPAAATTVSVTSSDTSILTVNPSPLTFTTANWGTPQTVTVNLPEDIDTANETATISLMATGVTMRTVAASITDNDTQTVIAAPDPVAIDEGTSGNLNVHLQFQPSSDITLTVTSLNTGVATVATGTLTFTPANYATDQAISVTAVQDPDAAAGMTTIRLESLPDSLSKNVAVAVTDDDQLLIEASPTTVTLAENGNMQFGVRLTAMPGANVTVSASSGDTTAATVSPAMMTFTPANYGTYQMVTVTGVSDLDLANESVTLTLSAAGLLPRTVMATVNDDDTQAIQVSAGTIQVGEGSTGQVGVTLAFMPAANVVVSVASADATAATVAPATLTFTPANYATAQNITITGVQDADAINDATMINLTATGATAAAVNVTVNDDEVLGIQTTVSNLNCNEPGTATFGVHLSAQPAADTVVMVMSSDVTAATAAPAMLTFTTANYATNQTVTVTGVSDADGINDTLTINLTATGLTAVPVNVTVIDDDTQDILLSAATLTVGEAGSGTFGVHLAAMPSSNVVVTVASADTNKATAAPAMLTFTSANYMTDQTVTVSGVADLNMTNESVSINLSSPMVTTRSVTVTVTDDDTQVVESNATGTVNLTEGAAGVAVGFRLRYQPAANTTVTLNLGTGLSVAGGNTLTFTSADYNTYQNKTISAVNDADAADVNTSLTATSPSATTATVNFFIDDDDILGIEVNTTALTVTEGTTQQFQVRLTAQPLADTVVTSTSSDTMVATITGGASLTFTTANYNTFQNVTVNGVQDADTATEGANVTVASAPLASKNVAVTVADDDVLAILTSVGTVDVNEGSTATFGVTLSAMPTSNVVVNLSSIGQPVFSITSPPAPNFALTFTPANYATSQNVTISGTIDSDFNDGSGDVQLTATGIPTSTVHVNAYDRDITLTDLSSQMGDPTGGTSLVATGNGFNVNTSATMSGNAVASPFAQSPTLFNLTTPAKSAAATNWADLRMTKAGSVSSIPRAFYYGQWTDSSTGFNGGQINELYIAPSLTSTVYVTTDGGFYRSTDSGATWTRASTGLPQAGMNSIVVHPTQPSTVLVAAWTGLYRTTNGGDTWATVGTFSTSVGCTGMNPANPAQIYVCSNGGLWRSVDSGVNWTQVATIPQFGASTTVAFTNAGTTAWLATDDGIRRSSDSGVTWTLVNTGLTDTYAQAVVAHPTNASIAWAGFSNGGVWKTINGGAGWTQVATPGTNYASGLATLDGTTVYAATNNGVYKSTDSGVNFSQQWSGVASKYNTLRSLALRGSDLYAGGGTLFKSVNAAQSWTRTDNGIHSMQFQGIWTHPMTSGTVYAASDAGFYKSTNYGASWTSGENGITTGYVNRIAFMPNSTTTMYAIGDRLYKSTDAGSNWAPTGNLPAGQQPAAIQVDPLNPQFLYATVPNFGLYRSTDAGVTFAQMTLPGTPGYIYAMYANGGSTVLAYDSTNDRLYRYDGAAWTIVANSGLPANAGIQSFFADPSGVIHASNYDNTYRSPDGGNTFTLFQSNAQKIVWDPTRPQTAYIFRKYSGVERTLNSFATRVGFNTGFSTDTYFGYIAIDKNGSTVYACYLWRGVYRITD